MARAEAALAVAAGAGNAALVAAAAILGIGLNVDAAVAAHLLPWGTRAGAVFVADEAAVTGAEAGAVALLTARRAGADPIGRAVVRLAVAAAGADRPGDAPTAGGFGAFRSGRDGSAQEEPERCPKKASSRAGRRRPPRQIVEPVSVHLDLPR
jgi:hypothetical protein